MEQAELDIETGQYDVIRITDEMGHNVATCWVNHYTGSVSIGMIGIDYVERVKYSKEINKSEILKVIDNAHKNYGVTSPIIPGMQYKFSYGVWA